MTAFGKNLKRIRKQHGLTQDGLAELLNTSKQVISRYENGQRSPKVSVVGEYAEKLGVPITELTDDEQNTATSTSTDILSLREHELLAIYRELNDLGQTTLIGTARGLAANPDMKK
ncbi:MAG: helix-turn-helix transcriptional regulator, partial [Oscillospiraceae bacterium]|nr:helix-turn-helix transcriptional regulator [Oscillospiraceae bacterium]